MHELTRQHEQSTGTSGIEESGMGGRDADGPIHTQSARFNQAVSKPGIWPWVIGGAALIALISSVNSDVRSIQSNLLSQSSATVEKYTSNLNKSNIQVSVDGRDVALTGKIQAAAQREQLVSELRGIDGVRIVTDDMREFDPELQAKNDRLAFKQAIEKLDASSVRFEPNSTALSEGSDLALDNVAALLRDAPQRQIKITGHTDNSGNAQTNLRISRQRAQSVADSLIRKGVTEEQLIVQGFGHTQPLYSNDTEAGRSRNRRIEFVFMK